MRLYWHCSIGDHPIEGDPHTASDGEDVCEAHCDWCNDPQMRSRPTSRLRVLMLRLRSRTTRSASARVEDPTPLRLVVGRCAGLGCFPDLMGDPCRCIYCGDPIDEEDA